MTYFTHALAQADKHSRWHGDHPEGGCESSLCEHPDDEQNTSPQETEVFTYGPD